MSHSLDNINIFRFAKIFKSGGGVETHLDALDKVLMQRNQVRIFRTFFDTSGQIPEEIETKFEKGRMVELPIPFRGTSDSTETGTHRFAESMKRLFKTVLVRCIFFSPWLYRYFFKKIVEKRFHFPGEYPVINGGELLSRVHNKYHIDLLVMHQLGTDDCKEILQMASDMGIPHIFINHFSNDCFETLSVRKQLSGCAGIAGVTDVNVPGRLRKRFYHVSNGIDTSVFDPIQTQPLMIGDDSPVIFYPARILPIKGQKDLITAYALLVQLGMRAKVVLAGRVDSEPYADDLKAYIARLGLVKDIVWLGQINGDALRNWYGVSSVLAFPTYHQEGLPRILLEAQAMKVPPVAYTSGGTSGAILDRKTGFLVRQGDIKAMVKKISLLISDQGKREEMGEAGSIFVRHRFSLNALAERHEKFYLRSMKRRGGG